MSAVLVAGLAVAALAWAVLFLPGDDRFWERALPAGLVIGVYGAVAQRHRLDDLWEPAVVDAVVGVATAAGLYGVFWLGDRVLRRLLPAVAADVGQLYAVSRASRPRLVPVVLVVVGASEEMFWRGFVQARAGVLVALVGYAAVHLWERKAALVLAAAVGGAAWSALFGWRGTVVAPVVCHALWDLAVVVWFPFRPVPRTGREG
ncbi:MAG TPA: CPBP family glutamic-type intramembrane protease [Acidimicrobiales bacterium]|nr:CPBP family glutamic-type intramembrane protease [Acidimicrobiales bacterium]